jgi:hypothetical protein
MRKFRSILESNEMVGLIKDYLLPLQDWDYDIKIVKSVYYRVQKDRHNNLGILSGDQQLIATAYKLQDNEDRLNSYAVTITRKRSGVIRNNQHGMGLYSMQNEIPLIDLTPQEMSNVISEFLGIVNQIKQEFDCEWSICSSDQFIIIVIEK